MKENRKWYLQPSNWFILIACIILVPTLIINLYIIFQSKTNQDEVPSAFGIKPFIVLSGSMESKIYKGDLIVTKKVDPSILKVEDIIAFRDSENTVTTHRIIDIVENGGEVYFITKGDNNNTQDQELVGYSDVEGIFIFRVPGVGSMLNALSKPTTLIILMLGITMTFVIGFMISMKKQRDLERKEFFEYKLMKEKEKQAKDNKKTKKVASKNVTPKKTTKKIEENIEQPKEVKKTAPKKVTKKIEENVEQPKVVKKTKNVAAKKVTKKMEEKVEQPKEVKKTAPKKVTKKIEENVEQPKVVKKTKKVTSIKATKKTEEKSSKK